MSLWADSGLSQSQLCFSSSSREDVGSGDYAAIDQHADIFDDTGFNITFHYYLTHTIDSFTFATWYIVFMDTLVRWEQSKNSTTGGASDLEWWWY